MQICIINDFMYTNLYVIWFCIYKIILIYYRQTKQKNFQVWKKVISPIDKVCRNVYV